MVYLSACHSVGICIGTFRLEYANWVNNNDNNKPPQCSMFGSFVFNFCGFKIVILTLFCTPQGHKVIMIIISLIEYSIHFLLSFLDSYFWWTHAVLFLLGYETFHRLTTMWEITLAKHQWMALSTISRENENNNL